MDIIVAPHTPTTIQFSCIINPELLGDWEGLSEEVKAFWKEDNNVVPCSGSGNTGPHCFDCRYSRIDDIFED